MHQFLGLSPACTFWPCPHLQPFNKPTTCRQGTAVATASTQRMRGTATTKSITAAYPLQPQQAAAWSSHKIAVATVHRKAGVCSSCPHFIRSAHGFDCHMILRMDAPVVAPCFLPTQYPLPKTRRNYSRNVLGVTYTSDTSARRWT